MRWLILSFALFAIAACGETSQPAQTVTTSSQNDLYNRWSLEPQNKTNIQAIGNFLSQQNVGHIISIEQILRSDVRWERCGEEAFNVPPKAQWNNIVATLKLIESEIIPLIGPVEAVSVYRNPEINRCIGGASGSRHMRFQAIDLKPKTEITREQLIVKLCSLSRNKGQKLGLGLGIYKGRRFHVDNHSDRLWGHDKRRATSPCLSNVAVQQ